MALVSSSLNSYLLIVYLIPEAGKYLPVEQNSSLEERLFLPLLRIESNEGIVGLHFYPAHLVHYVRPAFRFEELRGAELGAVVWHVVEHVEEHGIREGLDGLLRQALWLAHVVTLWDANVNLETVLVVTVAQWHLLYIAK